MGVYSAWVGIQAKELPMNARSLLAHLFHPGSNEAQAAAELLEAEQLIHLTPTLTADELPSEFEEILEVQVLGYRERLIWLHGGGRQRVLDPVWTLFLRTVARQPPKGGRLHE
jgi:hypothetical protein